jgi:hypothetical protein
MAENLGRAADSSTNGLDVSPTGARSGQPRSTHFRFDNKVFGLKGARFAPTRDTLEAALHVMLGDLQVAIPLPSLCQEFSIKPDSNDGELLNVVERSLRFVREIRPNDSIPREVLDGTASWSVEERHRLIAKGRLSLQIASWVTGGEAVVVDQQSLEQLVEDPLTKERVEKGYGEIAEKIGIGRDRKSEVADRIDEFARELSYIEALRERFMLVHEIMGKLSQLVRAYGNDRTTTQEISRVRTLLMRPHDDFENLFARCDAMTGEILVVLKKFGAQVQFVRDVRDELHSNLMKWDEVIEIWKPLEIARGEKAEHAIKYTYRFAARNYPQGQDWRSR